MLRVKAGVTPRNLVIAAAVANTAQALEIDATITSGTDGKHMPTSRHYTGEALDVRSRNMKPALRAVFVTHLRDRLGKSYQVVEEKDHIHIEYDPQGTR